AAVAERVAGERRRERGAAECGRGVGFRSGGRGRSRGRGRFGLRRIAAAAAATCREREAQEPLHWWMIPRAGMPADELGRLTKRHGARRGIDDVSLQVAAGEIVGFIGPNGAGKSTTIRVLLGLLRPTSGRARIFDRDASDPAARLDVGYVPGESAFYDDLRV